ncbi:MAG: bifunctional nuclease family protein [Simkaniaceae bacterium]|nr:bifunctional nuclease family protein [Simkaniaceae bacterium]
MSSNELIPLSCHKIMQSNIYTLFLLDAEEKKFAIYTEPKVGEDIEDYLSDETSKRPKTHELLNSVLNSLDVKPLQVLIYDVQDTIYFAKLFLEHKSKTKKTILEIDARPSDCLVLAIYNNIPIFCTKELLDKTVEVEN